MSADPARMGRIGSNGGHTGQNDMMATSETSRTSCGTRTKKGTGAADLRQCTGPVDSLAPTGSRGQSRRVDTPRRRVKEHVPRAEQKPRTCRSHGEPMQSPSGFANWSPGLKIGFYPPKKEEQNTSSGFQHQAPFLGRTFHHTFPPSHSPRPPHRLGLGSAVTPSTPDSSCSCRLSRERPVP